MRPQAAHRIRVEARPHDRRRMSYLSRRAADIRRAVPPEQRPRRNFLTLLRTTRHVLPVNAREITVPSSGVRSSTSLYACTPYASATLSGTVREKAESAGDVVREKAEAAGDIAREQAENAERAAHEQAEQAEQAEQ